MFWPQSDKMAVNGGSESSVGGLGASSTSHITVAEDFIMFRFSLSFPSRLSQPSICPHNGTMTPHNPHRVEKVG